MDSRGRATSGTSKIWPFTGFGDSKQNIGQLYRQEIDEAVCGWRPPYAPSNSLNRSRNAALIQHGKPQHVSLRQLRASTRACDNTGRLGRNGTRDLGAQGFPARLAREGRWCMQVFQVPSASVSLPILSKCSNIAICSRFMAGRINCSGLLIPDTLLGRECSPFRGVR